MISVDMAAPGVVAKAPKVRICYICGRGFGMSSIDIHEKQCKELYIAQQEKLPPDQRKPLPAKPAILGAAKAAAGEDAEALLQLQNEAAAATFNDAVMEACEHCGRTFIADRLKVHQRSCTAEKPSRPVGTSRLSEGTAAPVSSVRPKTSGGVVAGHYGGAAARHRRMIAAGEGETAAKGFSIQPPESSGDAAAMNARITELEKALKLVLAEVATLKQTVATLQKGSATKAMDPAKSVAVAPGSGV